MKISFENFVCSPYRIEVDTGAEAAGPRRLLSTTAIRALNTARRIIMDHTQQSTSVSKQGKRSCARWVLIGFIAIAGYLLFMEHRAHLSGFTYYLPFLLLLACPLMHVFMHRGHGGHRASRDDVTDSRRSADKGDGS